MEPIRSPTKNVVAAATPVYAPVRSKAIKVDQGFAQIIYDRCIGCGNCLSCPQKAKVIVDRMVRPRNC